MDMSSRYSRNEQMLSPEENKRLRSFRIAVAGCGGLGGHIIEMLARLGIGSLTLIDGDVFEVSNLNRQLLSTPENLGEAKAAAAKERVQLINPEVKVSAHQVMLRKENARELLANHHLVCDALDNIEGRKLLEKTSSDLGIPMVFGAIAGWYAQIGSIMPGEAILDKIYPEGVNKGAETHLGNPSFTPALAASLQVAEIVKILLHKEGVLKNQLLVIDTLKHTYQVIDL